MQAPGGAPAACTGPGSARLGGVTTESWSIRHFSQANPEGPEHGDVPRLLRLVADSIEELGEVEVQDVTFHTEINEDGPWHSMTVYFHRPDDE